MFNWVKKLFRNSLRYDNGKKFNDLSKGRATFVFDFSLGKDNPKLRIGFIKKISKDGSKMTTYLPHYGKNMEASFDGKNWILNN